MIVIILTEKIFSLFMIMMAGFLLVKFGILKSNESKILSELVLYLIMPCVILTAFQVEYTDQVRDGLMLALAAAVLIHIALLIIACFLDKVLHFDAVEQASVIYSNAGNLVIPLVAAILGKEWIIYSSAFVSVQLILLWSHGKALLCGEKRPDFIKMFKNVNMISVLCGIVLFITKIRFWAPVQDAMSSLSDMVGPASMLVTGMLIAGMSFEKIRSYSRLKMVVLLRLVICPAFVLLLLLGLSRVFCVENTASVLLVTLLATITPSASSITQMSQVYQRDADYAGAINMVSTILCIVTMPLYIMLYQMIML